MSEVSWGSVIFRKNVVKANVKMKREKDKSKKKVVFWLQVFEWLLNVLSRIWSIFVKVVCDELIPHNLWETFLVEGLSSLDYSVLCELPEEQTKYFWLSCLFNSFSVRDWMARELTTVHVQAEYGFRWRIEFWVLGDGGSGPEIGDLKTFLHGRQQLCRKIKAFHGVLPHPFGK